MKRGVVLASFGLIALAGWSSSEAAIRKWSVEAGAWGGFYKTDADARISETGIFGARLGLNVLPAVEVEATIDSISTESQQQAFSGSDFTEDAYGLRVLGTFLATEDVKATPYIVVGGGIVKTDFDRGSGFTALDDTANYSEIGAGVRYWIWKNLTARGEIIIRHFRTLDVTHADVIFAAGISYTFWGKK